MGCELIMLISIDLNCSKFLRKIIVNTISPDCLVWFHRASVPYQYQPPELLEEPRNEGYNDIRLLRKVFDMIVDDALIKGKMESTKVLNFKYPETLRRQLDLEIRSESSTEQELLDICKTTIDHSVLTAHPFCNNQLFQGVDTVGLAALYLEKALKTSIYTYEMAPVFSLVEDYILRKIQGLCGFERGDGMMSPGGSIGNMYAFNIARHYMNPDVKQKGLKAIPQNVIFTSEESHYSIGKGAMFLGFGLDNLCYIPTDERGKMIPEELEKAMLSKKEQCDPSMIVVATAGTTITGAYDPIDEIADICEKHQAWLHVDAAWGGPALLSKKHNHKMQGVHRADSLTWCLHKMMGIPLQCSVIVVNDKDNLLLECNSSSAQYLFQSDKFYGPEYDTGDKSIQCARLPDAFKLWFTWKAKGDILVEQQIDHQFDLARLCADIIRNRDGFRLLWEPECANVCFWYIPPSLRGLPDGPKLWDMLRRFAPLMKKKMMTSGVMMITYAPLKEKVSFWRMVFANNEFTYDNLVNILNEFERLAEEVEIE